MDDFVLNDDDFYAIDLARSVVMLFLKQSNIKPMQIVCLGHALFALDRMPNSTPGVYVEFGLTNRMGDSDFKEMRYIDFRVDENSFEISKGGSIFDSSTGSDSFSEPGWMIEAGGYQGSKNGLCDLSVIEDQVREMLNLGAEITVDDQSENISDLI